jgi:aryl-alcohol dehydrogenase-like predicted oxidoreductase
MNYGNVPGLDKPISRLVQGTVMVNGDNIEKEFGLLDAIFALGCTTFDTAHVYGSGKNERAVGQWVRDRGLREKVVIIAKGAHHNQDRKRVTPYDITADIFDSLARFKFDYLDLYILHRDDPSVPVGPIVEVLNEHHKAGRIRAFGGSNWSHERIREANEYADQYGLTPFVASSPNFSLAEQVKEPWDGCISIGGNKGKEARAYYQAQQTPLFTWSSLAGGFFSGRYRRDNLDSFTEYLDKLCVTSYCYEDNFKRLDRAEALAKQKGLSLPQIAMSYVMSQPLNIFALVGCQIPEEFKANEAAASLRLTEDEMRWLELGD